MSPSRAAEPHSRSGEICRLRPMQAGDYPALAAMHGAVFANGWDVGAINDLAVSFGVFGLVSQRSPESEICGFILGRIVAGEGEILTIVVAPEERNKGIGAVLLGGALKVFSDGQALEIFLEVAEENCAAIRLYQNYDFTQIGRRRNYATVAPDAEIQSDKNIRQDALQMLLNLR